MSEEPAFAVLNLSILSLISACAWRSPLLACSITSSTASDGVDGAADRYSALTGILKSEKFSDLRESSYTRI